MSKLKQPDVFYKVVIPDYDHMIDLSGIYHETEEAAYEEAEADEIHYENYVIPVVRCDFNCEECTEYDWEDDLCKFSMAAARTEFFKESDDIAEVDKGTGMITGGKDGEEV